MIFSLIAAISLSIFFGILTQYWATHYDHPRARTGLGYRMVGPIPASHHIAETAYFLFVGWALRIVLPLVGIPYWLVFVIVVIFTAGLYSQQGPLQRKYNLPDEPAWHVPAVLIILDIALLVGFFIPWPSF